jgi:CAP12/Pycsar effector protein, TIR domain/GAF domain
MDRESSPPRLFIGSSTEGLRIAEYLQLALEEHCESTIWNQGIFGLSQNTLASLVEATRNHDFAALVLTADDVTIKRGMTHQTARDNVTLELGLFIGSLGVNKTFVVYCKDDDIDVPTDLAGITLAPYRRRRDSNLQAALNPVSVRLREAFQQHGGRLTGEPNDNSSPEALIDYDVGRYVIDLIDSVGQGRAGLEVMVQEPANVSVWRGNLLGMLRDIYARRRADTYAAWLRPPDDRPKTLRVTEARNFKDERREYEFALGEGLAGKVWATGSPAGHSVLRQHPWWVFREGCGTTSYICVPVGEVAGRGGVLAVGSDSGFDVSDRDVQVVQMFAAALALTLGRTK